MKILVLNCGSSSVKYKLFKLNGAAADPLAEGKVERVAVAARGEQDLDYKPAGGAKVEKKVDGATHKDAIARIVEMLLDPEVGVLEEINEIGAVGHRVVHGGEKVADPVLVDEALIKVIEDYFTLSPLHNPANLQGIRAAMELLPGVPQSAIFDTAFHARMPERAWRYALPGEYYEKYGIRRYGFHGTSHRYVAMQAMELLEEVGVPANESKLITVHLGNGGSIAAVKGGVSIDTSMGTTPVEGLIMGTRCGDIDPAIPPFIMQKTGMSPAEFDTVMNKKSGLLALTGGYTDMRDILDLAAEGNERCELAVDMFCYRARKYIGSYVAALGGLDAVVFTGGIGENSGYIRARICEGLEYLGLEIDPALNEQRGQRIVSKAGTRARIMVIPTNEELMIALDTQGLIEKSAPSSQVVS